MWRLIGQQRALSLLQRSLEKKMLAHAYLFSGPQHIGKMTLAINLAQALNCQAEEKPCGECDACLKIEDGRHADVQVISIESAAEDDESRKRTEISIEQVRQLQHSSSLPPFEGSYKVFIIDGAELLSVEAANCLLKTLEEPAEKVVFTLLTTNTDLLLPTVQSRCQELKLGLMPMEAVSDVLQKDYNCQQQQAEMLSRLCNGCIGWAISAIRGDKTLEQYLERRMGILAAMEAGIEERFAYADKLARQFSREREEVQEILGIWLAIWRDLLLLKSNCGEIVANTDIKEKMVAMAAEYEAEDIRRFIDDVEETGKRLRLNANPRLVLEVLMLDVPYKAAERVRDLV